jgi:hypothetical protein
MAKSRFALHKYVCIEGTGWRYCKPAYHSNGKIKPNVVIIGKDKQEEKHDEGSYYVNHAGPWLPVDGDALAAQRERAKKMSPDEYIRPGGRPQIAEENPPSERLRSATDAPRRPRCLNTCPESLPPAIVYKTSHVCLDKSLATR